MAALFLPKIWKYGRKGVFLQNIKQEFGKWFLDVAKYVLTAMLLTSMIEGLSQTWILVATAAILFLSLAFGTLLMKKGNEEEKRREQNRNRNKK